MEDDWRKYFPRELALPDVNKENEPTWHVLYVRELKRMPITSKQDRELVELCHKNGIRNVEAWIVCMVKKMATINYNPKPGEENDSFWFESDEEHVSADGEEKDSEEEEGSEEDSEKGNESETTVEIEDEHERKSQKQSEGLVKDEIGEHVD
jgi:hypothetical protein